MTILQDLTYREFCVYSQNHLSVLSAALEKCGYKSIEHLVSETDFPRYIHTWENGDYDLTHCHRHYDDIDGHATRVTDANDFITEVNHVCDLEFQVMVTNKNEQDAVLDKLGLLGHGLYSEYEFPDFPYSIQAWHDKYLTSTHGRYYDPHRWITVSTNEFIANPIKAVILAEENYYKDVEASVKAAQNYDPLNPPKPDDTFDLVKAKDGDKVVTINDLPVKFYNFDHNGNIVGAVQDETAVLIEWDKYGNVLQGWKEWNLKMYVERTFPNTSLSDDDLCKVFGRETGYTESLRNVANAAIKQYILDNEK